MPPLITHFLVRPPALQHVPGSTTAITLPQQLVPVIPLDELPEWLDILGVPRSLTPEQTAGLTNLGCYERQLDDGVHDVEIIIPDEYVNGENDTDTLQKVIDAITTKAEDLDERESRKQTTKQKKEKEKDKKHASATSPGQRSSAPGIGAAVAATQPQQQPVGGAGGGLQASRWADRSSTTTADGVSPSIPNAGGAPAPAPFPGTACLPISPVVVSSTQQQEQQHPAERLRAHISPGQITPIRPAPASHAAPTALRHTVPGQPRRQSSATSTSTATTKTKNSHYCRHWVRFGTCKYGPYCRYAHSMPATASGLAEAGLSDFPAWWTRAAVGVAALAAGAGMVAPGGRGGGRRQKHLSALGSIQGLAGLPYAAYGMPQAGGLMGGGYALHGLGGLPAGLAGVARTRDKREKRMAREVHPQHRERNVGLGRAVQPGGLASGMPLGISHLGERRTGASTGEKGLVSVVQETQAVAGIQRPATGQQVAAPPRGVPAPPVLVPQVAPRVVAQQQQHKLVDI